MHVTDESDAVRSPSTRLSRDRAFPVPTTSRRLKMIDAAIPESERPAGGSATVTTYAPAHALQPDAAPRPRVAQAVQVQSGLPVTEVADQFGVSRQAVHRWLRWYVDPNLGGLADGSRRWRMPRPRATPSAMTTTPIDRLRASAWRSLDRFAEHRRQAAAEIAALARTNCRYDPRSRAASANQAAHYPELAYAKRPGRGHTVSDLFDLTGTTAVITGSSRGIGLAIARTLLGQGASVLINGYEPAETGATFEALQAVTPATPDGRIRLAQLPGDIATPEVAQQLIDEAVTAFGHLDHLICNAGIDIIKPAIDYTPDEWDRIMSVNVRGAFLPAQAAARHWIAENRPGSITMTSSIAGQAGIPTLAPYATSKGGINQLVRTLAAEWASHHIRVNAVAPGYVANIMDNVTAHDDPASDDRISTFTPLGRRATVDEIAAPYAFLAASAASYVTGSILTVDGGYTAT